MFSPLWISSAAAGGRLRGWHWLIQLAVVAGALFVCVAVGYWISRRHRLLGRRSRPRRGRGGERRVRRQGRPHRLSRQGRRGQNWAAKDSLWFDNVTQGSDLLPYDFFLVVEQPNGKKFRDNSNMNNRYRYLARKATYNNPDGLPIGLVKDNYGGRDFMGFTCSALPQPTRSTITAPVSASTVRPRWRTWTRS